MAHSLNSPSSFAKRRVCPASAMMESDLPESQSVYAAEGTAAHSLGEICLKSDKSPSSFIGIKMGEFRHKNGKYEQFIVDGDMVEAVDVYVNYCRSLFSDNTAIEQKFKLPFIGEGEKGTSDFVSLKDGVLHVVDYKHGQGVAVDVFKNIQGLCYGLGAADLYDSHDWHTLRITIVQPRAFHHGGPVRSWDVRREDLLDWEMEFSEVAELTRAPNPKLNPSEYCRWCKSAYRCMGIVELIREVMGMDLTKDDRPSVNVYKLSEDQIVDILFNKLPIIERWVHQLKDYAQQRAEERNPLPGTKLVETREHRKWIDEKEAEAFFSQFPGAYDKKLKSAPQMEKLLGKKIFNKHKDDYVMKVSSGVTLVPIDDPRPSARPSGEDEFCAVDINLF